MQPTILNKSPVCSFLTQVSDSSLTRVRNLELYCNTIALSVLNSRYPEGFLVEYHNEECFLLKDGKASGSVWSFSLVNSQDHYFLHTSRSADNVPDLSDLEKLELTAHFNLDKIEATKYSQETIYHQRMSVITNWLNGHHLAEVFTQVNFLLPDAISQVGDWQICKKVQPIRDINTDKVAELVVKLLKTEQQTGVSYLTHKFDDLRGRLYLSQDEVFIAGPFKPLESGKNNHAAFLLSLGRSSDELYKKVQKLMSDLL